MFEIIEKTIARMRSFWIGLLLKMRYRNRISLGKGNSFRGTVNVWIDKQSSIKASDKLLLLGPTYLKAVHGGNLEIGNNCFFNRNCSVTSVGNTKIGSYCTFANNLVMVDHDHNIYTDKKRSHTILRISVLATMFGLVQMSQY